MAISEKQLESWSGIGSQVQSAKTYQDIKKVLDDKNAPYAGRQPLSYLQGSYGNDTNIIGVDSDVDIVLQCDSVYYYDLSNLTEPEQELYKSTHHGAEYNYATFKGEVGGWLQKNYGSDLVVGEKAMHLKPNGGRRKADVLPCVSFKRYTSYKGDNDAGTGWYPGICFFSPDNSRIENFPKQHHDNLVTKHQATNSYLKPMVRIIKNMRNRMRDDGLIEDGIAPSYFIEGLLSNVPDNLFGTSYQQSFLQAYRYLAKADRSKLVCANRLHWLVLKDRKTSWDPTNFDTFFAALGEFYDNF